MDCAPIVVQDSGVVVPTRVCFRYYNARNPDSNSLDSTQIDFCNYHKVSHVTTIIGGGTLKLSVQLLIELH